MLGKTIGDKTVEFLADNFRNNIRDLEGKLNQVLALSDLRGISPDDLIDEGMIVPPQEEVKRRSISPKQVIEKVAKYYDLTSKDLYGTSRVKNIKNARQIAMFLLKDQLNLSTVRIGQEFSKDHTTIMHGIKVIETALKTDFNLRQQITDLRGKINAD
jgi:chromosomal replication initiator protein